MQLEQPALIRRQACECVQPTTANGNDADRRPVDHHRDRAVPAEDEVHAPGLEPEPQLGAWAGHVNAAAHAPEGTDMNAIRRREIPLAVVMVALTTLTLWSLGQSIVVAPPENPPATTIDVATTVA